MIKVDKLNVYYGEHKAISNISFDLERGDDICFLGSNGCGKTTLIKALSGNVAYEGSIKLMGNEVCDMTAMDIAKQIAVLGQLGEAYFPYTVFQTVMLGRYSLMGKGVFKAPSKHDIEYVNYCLEVTSIQDIANRNINELSGGQLQKVYLARAIAQEPTIIMLDEPTNHLDVKSQEQLLLFIKEWKKQEGKSIIGVLHDLPLAYSIFEKGILLKEGNSVYNGNLKTKEGKDMLSKAFDFDINGYIEKTYSNFF